MGWILQLAPSTLPLSHPRVVVFCRMKVHERESGESRLGEILAKWSSNVMIVHCVLRVN